MTKHALSELEGVCLGLIRKHGPCTAYQVRQQLKVAPSSHWQASAGSVYPLLLRLETKDLIVKTPDIDDGRGRKMLRITRKGAAALRKWLLIGAEPETISSMTDPVRSRLFFLDVLSAGERSGYLDDLIAEMEIYLSKTKKHLRTLSVDDNRCDYFGSLGATKIAEARLEWLRAVAAMY